MISSKAYDNDQGLKEDLQTDPPCHARACAIQSNLAL
jgi:hypothetical protein